MIEQVKDIITRVAPQLAEADVATVLQSIRDPTCLAVRPRMGKTDQLLEDNASRRHSQWE